MQRQATTCYYITAYKLLLEGFSGCHLKELPFPNLLATIERSYYPWFYQIPLKWVATPNLSTTTKMIWYPWFISYHERRSNPSFFLPATTRSSYNPWNASSNLLGMLIYISSNLQTHINITFKYSNIASSLSPNNAFLSYINSFYALFNTFLLTYFNHPKSPISPLKHLSDTKFDLWLTLDTYYNMKVVAPTTTTSIVHIWL